MLNKARRDEYASEFPDGLEAFETLQGPRKGNTLNTKGRLDYRDCVF